MSTKEQTDKNDEYGPLEAPERFDNATADQKRGAFEWLRAQALTNGLDSFQPALAMHELVRLHREVEQLQVKLAGCSVAALGWNKEPAKRGDYGWSQSYQDVLDLRGKYERTPSARLFKVMGGLGTMPGVRCGYVPFDLVAAHERQAKRNHGGQTVQRLNERGGLSPSELAAVLEDREWRRMQDADAWKVIDDVVQRYVPGSST